MIYSPKQSHSACKRCFIYSVHRYLFIMDWFVPHDEKYIMRAMRAYLSSPILPFLWTTNDVKMVGDSLTQVLCCQCSERRKARDQPCIARHCNCSPVECYKSFQALLEKILTIFITVVVAKVAILDIQSQDFIKLKLNPKEYCTASYLFYWKLWAKIRDAV